VAELRAALRLSRQESTLGIDVHTAVSVPESPSAGRVLNRPESLQDGDETTFVDELDEDVIVDDGHFYDEVLEDV
jgi:hypothetical protein